MDITDSSRLSSVPEDGTGTVAGHDRGQIVHSLSVTVVVAMNSLASVMHVKFTYVFVLGRKFEIIIL